MFYSRELLARKASLGQIWLLGTRQAKLDRRKANKLDIARLCEEILNPPVPIALRLSSILMGGVVILYEKKVMFLHDDANRFLVEIRNAWKVMNEPTLLPKRKEKAKRKSITLPENDETSMGFTNVGELEEEISMGPGDSFRLADDNDITLFDLFQPNSNIHGQFERFEEADEGTQVNFTLDEHIQIPTTPIPSPSQKEPQRAGGTQERHPEHQLDQQFNKNKEARDQQRQGSVKQRRKPKGIITDEEQTVISNHVYHSWLHDTSDIASRIRRKNSGPASILSTFKIAKLMELPSTVIMDDMLLKGNQEISYPEPLLDLWKKCSQPLHDSPSDLHSGVGSPSHAASIEVQRANVVNKVTPAGINQFVSPGNSGDAVRYTGSSVSGDGVPSGNLEVNIERVGSKKKNLQSTSKNSGSLDTVVEVFHEADTDYQLSRPKRKNLEPDHDFLVETQLTMETPADDPPDMMTENIKKHMKTHFETPGAPQVESLQNLAAGLNKKGAAQLFYRTCVLASQGFLKVQQKVAFGDIFISKGAKM
ncbi:hypothetical protein ERO13_A05G331501v2 [Gossypium hirsutum]|uniref:Rad21/Rec8-like protein N-terminal domain-containing protein n=3 Tax=Gossypium TaxID=3633 RepID=A0A5J5VWS8_GOSBA|nr:hypothetical protein ES319_A05G348900v1 [Gossypium barbadense]KAG4202330.1 hypothetical protein ERO13_A05G331501v2 [Gossypium hirsutum]TYH19650.1 hypothetical protein ES288_A05G368400v1 [Gossypium darwinii]TYJ37192.1 hypothetical protein E1A91_A05G359900v1 [Gossypium mustelinum]